MPEFFFGQPVIYHKEPNVSVTSKLEPKWKEGVFLCLLHPGKVVILDYRKRLKKLHPRQIKAIPSTLPGLPEMHSNNESNAEDSNNMLNI